MPRSSLKSDRGRNLLAAVGLSLIGLAVVASGGLAYQAAWPRGALALAPAPWGVSREHAATTAEAAATGLKDPRVISAEISTLNRVRPASISGDTTGPDQWVWAVVVQGTAADTKGPGCASDTTRLVVMDYYTGFVHYSVPRTSGEATHPPLPAPRCPASVSQSP
jgi:hypothetical protein